MQGQFMSFQPLRFKIQGVTQTQYNQVRSLINDLLARQQLREDLRKLEQTFYLGGIFKKALSKLYDQLLLKEGVKDKKS